nr:tail fiber assembly protein [Desulfovibrio sp.]
MYDGYQGAVRLAWHDPAKAAGPLPALFAARRVASLGAGAPETVNLYDPETGQGSVWRPEDAEAKLAEGLITEAAWREMCDARAAGEYARWLASPETEAERFELLRAQRDAKLNATDYLMAADYPLSEERRAAVTAYRQALRDLPAQEGAPWDGGGELTPWPQDPHAGGAPGALPCA